MPINFSPDMIVRYDSTFLNYVNRNFQRIQEVLLRAGKETISSTAPTSPYTGQTYFDPTALTEYVWNGSAWVEKAYVGGTNVYVPVTAQAIPNVTLTPVTWNTGGGLYDPTVMTYTGASQTWTVVKAGTYCIESTLLYQTYAAGGVRAALVLHNGAYVKRNGAPPIATFDTGVQVAYNARLAAGDTIKIVAFHEAGIALNIINLGTFFNAIRTGP